MAMHPRRAISLDATQEELIEAMWVAANISAASVLNSGGASAEVAIQQTVAGSGLF
jgi:hypothetical protein